MSFFSLAKTVLKSLFSKPATGRYPFAPKEYVKGSRGKIEIDIKRCIFCGMCQRKCPTAALAVAKSDKTWEIDRLRCVICGYCVDVCPVKCLRMENTYTPPCEKRTKDLVRYA